MWVLAWGAAVAAPWSGTINQAHDRGSVLIGPFPDALRDLAAQFGMRADPGASALPDDGVPALYGDPGSNPLLREVLAWHGLALEPNALVVGGVRVPLEDPFLIAALPRPGREGEPVLVYTASAAAAQPILNAVHHGPTAVVLGSWDGAGEPVVRFKGPLTTGPDGRVTGIGAARAALTAEQAVEDLRALNDALEAGYVGLVDLPGWEARTDEVEARLRAQPTWPWSAFFDALLGWLAPVADNHFTLAGSVVGPDGAVTRSARLVTAWRPRFADGRLTGGPGAWSLDGEPLSEAPPPVPGAAAVEAGVAYRFPTVLPGGEPAWLIGAFELLDQRRPRAGRGGSSLPPLSVGGRELPLHVPLSERAEATEPWRLVEGPIPVLSVATMNEDLLGRGMARTGRTLRGRDRVVLDLRGNGGGSDAPAIAWVRRFCPTELTWPGARDLAPGDAPASERLRVYAPDTFGGGRGCEGELGVLVDGGVASSGETFSGLASQLPVTVLVGTNTYGCARYGNISPKAPLPHSGIVATFGHTAFEDEAAYGLVEGRGMFPHVWLDEPDPVAFVTALPRGALAAARDGSLATR